MSELPARIEAICASHRPTTRRFDAKRPGMYENKPVCTGCDWVAGAAGDDWISKGQEMHRARLTDVLVEALSNA